MRQNRVPRQLVYAAVFSVVLAFYLNLALPFPFAWTQLILDYEFGMIRRGLFDNFFTMLAGPDVTAPEAFAAAALVTLTCALALAVLTGRTMIRNITVTLLFILVVNSFAYGSLLGNTGYLDGVLAVLLVAVLLPAGYNNIGIGTKCLLVMIGTFSTRICCPLSWCSLVWTSGSRSNRVRCE